MLFGAHITIQQGIEKTPLLAEKIGCECFQFFTKSPTKRDGKIWTNEEITEFKQNLAKTKIENFYIHAPYYIGLASSNNKVYYGSIKALRDDLETGTKIGAKYLMTHIGSSKDFGEKESIKKVISALKKVLEGYKGETKLLLENSAGAGNIIGDSWQEIGQILSGVKNENMAGICLDTAHSFESGYDLRNSESLENVLEQLDKFIGIEKIKMFHANDSATELGSHCDRHSNIGKGEIGLMAFQEIIGNPAFKHLDMILETPGGEKNVAEDLEVLKE